MGLLSQGTPLSWEKTKQYADHVRKHGILQFLAQYRKLQSRKKDVLYWGDEIEYQLVKFDHENKKVRVSLRAAEVLAAVQEKTKQKIDRGVSTSWHWEYASYMVEATPGKPYGGMIAHFNIVQSNMMLRRQEIQRELKDDEAPLSLSTFTRLGCPDFTHPPAKPSPKTGVSKSLFFPDQAINNSHVRFATLTRNVRERRQSKVAINVPIFKDEKTPSPFKEDFSAWCDPEDEDSCQGAKEDHIYMDCSGFGMGNCCLQVTFQACSIDEALVLYDQLTNLCPIMLALSASSPIFRGYLADIDVRWPVICGAMDDRTDEERGLKPLKDNRFVIPKSRYDSVSSYLSPRGQCCNDIDLVIDQDIYQQLKDNGIEEPLAKHMAHLFIRDPISLFEEKIDLDDENDTDHFENIQSTNWQSMRFKPPPPNSDIGWRVEFRPMEVQLTDFENAAYTVFIVLMTRVILSYKLNLLVPISKVDENMKRSFKRDAVLNEKFYFRKDILTENTPPECAKQYSSGCCGYTQMTVQEIFQGKDEFPGLLPLINLYINSIEIDADTRCTIMQYLNLISQRASGDLNTAAHWMRDFVTAHPEYEKDSVVSDHVAYDLLWRVNKIARGEVEEPSLLFPYCNKSSADINPAVSMAEAFINQRSPPSNSGKAQAAKTTTTTSTENTTTAAAAPSSSLSPSSQTSSSSSSLPPVLPPTVNGHA